MDIRCKLHPSEKCDVVCHGCTSVVCLKCVDKGHECKHPEMESRYEALSPASLVKCIDCIRKGGKELEPFLNDVIRRHETTEEKFLQSSKEVSLSLDSMANLIDKISVKMKENVNTAKSELENKMQNTCTQQALRVKKSLTEDLSKAAEISKNPGDQTVSDLWRKLKQLKDNLVKHTSTITALSAAEQTSEVSLTADNAIADLCRSMMSCSIEDLNVINVTNRCTPAQIIGGENNRICLSSSNTLEKQVLALISEFHVDSGNKWKNEQCSFSDVVLISNTVLVVDFKRLKLKRLNFKGELIDWIRIGGPYGLTTLPKTDDVIVTQPSEKGLTRVSTTSALKLVNTVHVEQPYYVVRAIDDNTLLASTIAAPIDKIAFGTDNAKSALGMNTRIHMILVDGTPLKVLHLTNSSYENVQGTILLPDYESFAVCSDKLFVIRLTDMEENNFVAGFNREGRNQWMYQVKGTVRGLCSKSGMVYAYVANTDGTKMLALTDEGKPERNFEMKGYSGRGNILHIGDKGLAVVDFSSVLRVFALP